MKIISSAIVLVGIVLLGKTVDSVAFFHEKPEEVLRQLDVDGLELGLGQVEEILRNADPKTIIGSVSVKDLLNILDKYTIEDCTKKELDSRLDTCEKVKSNKNVYSFCMHKFENGLAQFCGDKFEQVVRANMIKINGETRKELEYFVTAIKSSVKQSGGQLVGEPTDEQLEAAIVDFLDENKFKHLSSNFKKQVGPKCQKVTDNLDSAKSIADYNNATFEQLTTNESLLKMLNLYNLCKIFVSGKHGQ